MTEEARRSRAEGSHPRPLVSIVMATHNRPATLRRAVASVMAQSYENLELIVVNDAGCGVEEALRDLDRHGRILHVRLPVNRGLAAARNHGLRLVRGEYVGFLDDDDMFDPHHVETLVDALRAGTHRIAYANTRRRIEVLEGNELVVKRIDDPCPEWCQPYSPDAFLVQNLMPVQSILFHRCCLEACGSFDETLFVLEDWELWLRFSRKFPFLHVEKTTSTVNWRPDGLTRTRARDFHGCAKRILARYRQWAEGRPDVMAAQQQLLANLRRSEQQQRPTCSIIVPFRDEPAAQVRGFLRRTRRITRGVSFEIIAADAGCSEDARREIERLDVARSIAAGERTIAAAMHGAIAEARGQHLVFVRPDTLLEEGWLSALLAASESAPGGPAISGSVALTPRGTVLHAGLVFRQLDGEPRALLRGAEATAPELTAPFEVEAIAGPAVLVPEAVARQIGVDARCSGWSAIADLCLRARVSGTRSVVVPRCIAYVPNARIEHVWPEIGADSEALSSRAREVQAALRHPLLTAAREALARGSHAETDRLIAEVKQSAPEPMSEVALLEGIAALDLGHHQRAVVLLESAMSMGDDGFSARLALGVAYLGVDDPQRAWKVLASLARRHADDELVVHQLYRAGLATGCWSELADLLARYVTFRPDDYEKRYAFASVCVRAGRLEEARAHYHHLRSIMPTMIGLDHLRRRLESQAPATMPIALRA